MSVRSLFEPPIYLAPQNDEGAEFDAQESEGLEDFEDLGDEGPDEGGVDADSGEDESTGEDEGQEDGRSEAEPAEPVRRPSRAERRVETALREAREAKAELARLRETQTHSQSREQQEREAAQERERLANMDPEQRLEYRILKQEQAHRQEMQQLQFTMQDSADKTAFEGLCARNPVAQRLQGEVEDRLAEMRRGGTTAPRETVLRWVIGDRALANATRAKGRATKRAETNRVAQTTRPGSGRGDVAGETRRATGDSREARAKRLEGLNI
jgi:hypothetical protein